MIGLKPYFMTVKNTNWQNTPYEIIQLKLMVSIDDLLLCGRMGRGDGFFLLCPEKVWTFWALNLLPYSIFGSRILFVPQRCFSFYPLSSRSSFSMFFRTLLTPNLKTHFGSDSSNFDSFLKDSSLSHFLT